MRQISRARFITHNSTVICGPYPSDPNEQPQVPGFVEKLFHIRSDHPHSEASCTLSHFPSFGFNPSLQDRSTSQYLVDIGIHLYFQETSVCFLSVCALCVFCLSTV